MTGEYTALTLPELPYAYDALEPVISKEIMELHHKKHHQAYVNNYNKALENYIDAQKKGDLGAQIALFQLMKFNGGGHINHSIFWTNLAPSSDSSTLFPKSGPLFDTIQTNFGSFDAFKEMFSNRAIALQGSGWVWLVYSPQMKRCCIIQCDNQDPANMFQGNVPLLGLDVWEHAYYLQYKNVRADYVKAIWSIINWKNVEERYLKASKAV